MVLDQSLSWRHRVLLNSSIVKFVNGLIKSILVYLLSLMYDLSLQLIKLSLYLCCLLFEIRVVELALIWLFLWTYILVCIFLVL